MVKIKAVATKKVAKSKTVKDKGQRAIEGIPCSLPISLNPSKKNAIAILDADEQKCYKLWLKQKR